MATGNLIHRSRRVTEDLQFTANGETSWSFVAEGDGEIFAVESSNVASYTINGGVVTLPFDLVNGNSYTVAITKTTSGQVADIQLKTRRAVDKTKTVNVPDLGQFSGRYLYLLNDNNQVEKHDTNNRQPANYIGGGTWNATSLVVTISLPVITDVTWRDLCFVNEGSQGKVVVFGTHNTNAADTYWCIIVNDQVYDLTETVINGSTNYNPVSASGVTVTRTVMFYDYMNQQVWACATSNVRPTFRYDFTDDTFAYYGQNDSQASFINKAAPFRKQQGFVPETKEVIGPFGLFNAKENINGIFTPDMQYGAYDIDLGYIYTTASGTVNMNQLYTFNKQGQLVSLQSASPTVSAANQGSWIYHKAMGEGFVSNQTFTAAAFGIYKKSTSLFSLYTLTDSLGSYYIQDRCGSAYSGIWMATQREVNTDQISTRLFFMKSDQTPFDYGYEDFATNSIRAIVTDQLMV